MLLLATLAVGCSKPERQRLPLQIVALDDGSALLTWEDAPRTHGVSRIGRDARLLWSTDLDGHPFGRGLDRGVVLTDRLVALRTYRYRELNAEGVLLETGRRSWITPLRAVEGHGDGPDVYTGYANAQSIRLFLRAEMGKDGSELVDIDPMTGRKRGTTRLPIQTAMQGAPAHLAGELFIGGGAGEVLVTTGQDVARFDSRGYGCIIGDEYWRLVGTPTQWELAPTRDKHRRSIPIGTVAADRNVWLIGCGAYRDSFVVFVNMGGAADELRVVDANGNVLRRAVLGESASVDAWRTTNPWSPETGTLPRFVPVVLGAKREELAVVDLEQGAVVRQGPSSSSADVFRGGNHWYWTWYEKEGANIVVFDGDTGKAKSVRLAGPDRIARLGPANVGGDSLWVLSSILPARGNAPTVARLDAKTLKVQFASPPLEIIEVPVDDLNEVRNP
ncbi:MAG TPA: hypothetical protein VK427_16050 [Kofleriaceae bacterium]|nr:hypothetical protein [Kofleriaceae bacterium]